MLPGQLLRLHPMSPPPDMSPFFLRQYVKGHASDVFEAYPQLLTEMVLRLPYQVKAAVRLISTLLTYRHTLLTYRIYQKDCRTRKIAAG